MMSWDHPDKPNYFAYTPWKIDMEPENRMKRNIIWKQNLQFGFKIFIFFKGFCRFLPTKIRPDQHRDRPGGGFSQLVALTMDSKPSGRPSRMVDVVIAVYGSAGGRVNLGLPPCWGLIAMIARYPWGRLLRVFTLKMDDLFWPFVLYYCSWFEGLQPLIWIAE